LAPVGRCGSVLPVDQLVNPPQLAAKPEAGLLNKSSCSARALGVLDLMCYLSRTWMFSKKTLQYQGPKTEVLNQLVFCLFSSLLQFCLEQGILAEMEGSVPLTSY
jgi:hypothetical protein